MAEAAGLAEQIAALYAADSWNTPAIFLARSEADFVLVGSAVSEWINRGTGSNATQATGTARPTYSATAVNGRPGMTLDGGDWLRTPLIDASAATAYVLTVLFFDSETASKVLAEFGDAASGATGMYIRTNQGAVGELRTQFRGPATISSAASAASFDMSTPAVVTATVDRSLSASETTIRHGGGDVTSTRPSDGDSAASIAPSTLTIGARNTDGSLGIVGGIGAVVLACGTTAIPTATVAAVESLLAASKGL